MPELPEVEVVRRGLAGFVPGRTISQVTVYHPRPVRHHPSGPEGFCRELTGQRLGHPRRRGKYLWIPFGDDALVIHLGMSGQFRINRSGDPTLRHTRVVIDFQDTDQQLRFVDQRIFGRLQISRNGADGPELITHIAPDPLDAAFDTQAVAERIRARRTTVKRALLDQRLLSGVGNIYADEALWRTAVHYDTPTADLNQDRALELLANVTAVMRASLARGGTSFDELYVDVAGEAGYFEVCLDAYGRQGQPCRRCGEAIVREHFMNRSSYRCPHCQPTPLGCTLQGEENAHDTS